MRIGVAHNIRVAAKMQGMGRVCSELLSAILGGEAVTQALGFGCRFAVLASFSHFLLVDSRC